MPARSSVASPNPTAGVTQPPADYCCDPAANAEFPPPDFGRTVRLVGTVANVDPRETPHPKNSRGELGAPLFNYFKNTVASDPIARVIFPTHTRDWRNVFRMVLQRAPKGTSNPDQRAVAEPAQMSAHIKRAGRYFGADVVGIGKAHPSMLYAGGLRDEGTSAASEQDGPTPEELCRRYPHVIVAAVAWDYALGRAHRHHIGDAVYDSALMQTVMILAALEGCIRELGYTAVRGRVNPQAAALAAGVGELGRNGLIISRDYGARIQLNDVILTDLPLQPDHPIDIGVEDFCRICRKCAETCPTNSISFEGKQVYNGVEKYKIKWETCYKLRAFTTDHWAACLTCATVCPFTKPNVWWRALAVRTLSLTPIPFRPPLVRGLKWMDDRFYGRVPNKRVRWLSYDTGVKPGVKGCTVAGCTAQHGDEHGNGKVEAPRGDVGYYMPLKENVNRFVKRA